MIKNWVPIWVIPMIIAFGVCSVWLRLAIVRTTYAIGEADAQIARARQDREALQIRAAALRSPRRLEILARTKFRLSQPQLGRVVHFKSPEGQHGRPSGHGK